MRRQINDDCKLLIALANKGAKDMETLSRVIFLCTFVNTYAWAASSNPIAISCRLSSDSITSGSPVSLFITAANTTQESCLVKILGNSTFSRDTFNIHITSQTVSPQHIHRRNLPIYSSAFMWILHSEIMPETSVTVEYPLHLQWDTRLPAGVYSIMLSPIHIIVVRKSSVSKTGETHIVLLPPLTVNVRNGDESSLRENYRTILGEVCRKQLGPKGSIFQKLPSGAATLLCAYGAAATDSQLDLLFSESDGFAFSPRIAIYAWENIAQNASSELARRIVEMSNNCNFWRRDCAWKWQDLGFVWCIHRMNESGSSEVSTILASLCDKYPEQYDLKYLEYEN